jgi:Uma2 family endonuclease
MSENARDSFFDRWIAELPEGKLELIDGKLVIGTLKGSRRIVRELLQDYGPSLFLPMAPAESWREALGVAFRAEPRPRTPEEWLRWADGVDGPAEVAPAGPQNTWTHRRIYQLLQSALYHIWEATGSGLQLGRDFVTRLGEDGLTPDVMFFTRARYSSLFERYLDGPPTIAIEVTLPGSEDQDRVLKRRLYERAGVPEFWLIEPEVPRITFHRLQPDGSYDPLVVDDQTLSRIVATKQDFVYDSAAVPGLHLSLLDLWTMEEVARKEPWRPLLPFEGGSSERTHRRRPPARKGGIDWDTIPFGPRVALHPVPIRFEEYASWCGRAKVERYDGGLKIGGTEGTRRVAGMLLMTFGLVDVVRLAHPREWVMFLDRDEYQEAVRREACAFLAQASYDSDEWDPGEISYHSEVPRLPVRWGWGETFEECRNDLGRAVENWVLLRMARREPCSTDEE